MTHPAEDLFARALGLLEIGRLKQHRALVLGAWGCGARKHSPEAVAGAFKEALHVLDTGPWGISPLFFGGFWRKIRISSRC